MLVGMLEGRAAVVGDAESVLRTVSGQGGRAGYWEQDHDLRQEWRVDAGFPSELRAEASDQALLVACIVAHAGPPGEGAGLLTALLEAHARGRLSSTGLAALMAALGDIAVGRHEQS